MKPSRASVEAASLIATGCDPSSQRARTRDLQKVVGADEGVAELSTALNGGAAQQGGRVLLQGVVRAALHGAASSHHRLSSADVVGPLKLSREQEELGDDPLEQGVRGSARARQVALPLVHGQDLRLVVGALCEPATVPPDRHAACPDHQEPLLGNSVVDHSGKAHHSAPCVELESAGPSLYTSREHTATGSAAIEDPAVVGQALPKGGESDGDTPTELTVDRGAGDVCVEIACGVSTEVRGTTRVGPTSGEIGSLDAAALCCSVRRNGGSVREARVAVGASVHGAGLVAALCSGLPHKRRRIRLRDVAQGTAIAAAGRITALVQTACRVGADGALQ